MSMALDGWVDGECCELEDEIELEVEVVDGGCVPERWVLR